MLTDRVRIDTHRFSGLFDVYIFSDDGDKRTYIKTVTRNVAEIGVEAINPITSMTKSQAQELMDDLYRCGIRPTESIGTQGEKDALKDHLKSMKEVYEKQAETNQQLLDYVIGKKQQ